MGALRPSAFTNGSAEGVKGSSHQSFSCLAWRTKSAGPVARWDQRPRFVVSVAGFEELRLQVLEASMNMCLMPVSVAGFEELRLQVAFNKRFRKRILRFSCWV